MSHSRTRAALWKEEPAADRCACATTARRACRVAVARVSPVATRPGPLKDYSGKVQEVARVLLLPDIAPASDGLLLNLAMYWDTLVIPTRDGRLSDLVGGRWSATCARFEAEGIVEAVERSVPIHSAVPPWPGHEEPLAGAEPFFTVEPDEQGRAVYKRVIWLNRQQAGLPAYEPDEWKMLAGKPFALGRLMADILITRSVDALRLADASNLATVAPSLAGQLASLAAREDATSSSRQAALVAAVVESFAIPETTSPDDVIRFRERAWKSMGRFRASLADLAERLSDESNPERLMVDARDLVRNRVQPALGDLEDVLKQNRFTFYWKALTGATALTLAPLSPQTVLGGATQLMAQTVDYRFSKRAMARSHPYGLLHEVKSELSGDFRRDVGVQLGTEAKSPRELLRVGFGKLYESASAHSSDR